MSIRTPEFNRKQSSLNEQILLFILIEKEEKLGKKKDWKTDFIVNQYKQIQKLLYLDQGCI